MAAASFIPKKMGRGKPIRNHPPTSPHLLGGIYTPVMIVSLRQGFPLFWIMWNKIEEFDPRRFTKAKTMHSFSPSACLSHSIFVWDMFLQAWLIFRLTNIHLYIYMYMYIYNYIYICMYVYINIYTHTLWVKRKTIEHRQQPRFGHLFMSGAKAGGIYVARSWHEVVIRNSSSPKSLVFVSHIISPLYSVPWLVKRPCWWFLAGNTWRRPI